MTVTGLGGILNFAFTLSLNGFASLVVMYNLKSYEKEIDPFKYLPKIKASLQTLKVSLL